MVKAFRVLCVAALVLYAGMSMAAENKADPRSVQTLMNKSGLNKQLEQISPMVRAGMAQANQQSQALPPEALGELNDMAARAYDATVLKEAVQQHIQSYLSERDIQAALAWLDSPLGMKITKLEEDASTPAAMAEMRNSAGREAGNAGRVELLKKLDNAVKATETGVAVALNTQTALVAALTSGAAPEERRSMDEIANEVMKNKGQLQSLVEQETRRSFLFTYRSLSDAEIAQYIDFAMSASGKKYHAVTSAGVAVAVTKAADTLGSLMAAQSKKTPAAAVKQDI